jgi:SAM-dependent methyltransferase
MTTFERSEESDRRSLDDLEIFFPEVSDDTDQDQEWCAVQLDGHRRRIRFHDYHEIYSIPGLYEYIFYDKLKCSSPQTVRGLLEEQLRADSVDVRKLRALDVGAGNGMVGEELAQMGVQHLVGVDIIQEAEDAANRDRPSVYNDYFVVDLTDIGAEDRRSLEVHRFNCLASVGALGFDDMPPRAFAEAYNFVSSPGWIAFNIKGVFLDERDQTGFSRLIGRMFNEGILEQRAQCRYQHRLSVTGRPLHYEAIVSVKHDDVPLEWVAELA